MDLDRGAALDLRLDEIPPDLKPLIPIVRKWGFDRPEQQDAFVAEMMRNRPDEIRQFNDAVDAKREAIIAWSASLGQLDRGVSEWSQADWAHPIWCFLSVLKVRELTGPGSHDAEQEKAARSAFAAEKLRMAFESAVAEAEERFRLRDFAECARILARYEDMLSSAQSAKLKACRERIS